MLVVLRLHAAFQIVNNLKRSKQTEDDQHNEAYDMIGITLFEVLHVENDLWYLNDYRTFGKRHSNVHTQLPHPHTH